MLSIGSKICVHIDYEMQLEKGLEHPAIIRNLVTRCRLHDGFGLFEYGGSHHRHWFRF